MYGVLAAAMTALWGFMEVSLLGTVRGTITDGDHEFARGLWREAKGGY